MDESVSCPSRSVRVRTHFGVVAEEVRQNHLVDQTTELRVVRRNEGNDRLHMSVSTRFRSKRRGWQLTCIWPLSAKRNTQSSQSLALKPRILGHVAAAFSYWPVDNGQLSEP